MHRWIAAALLFVTVGAHAQPEDGSDHARALFQQGLEHAERQEWPQAEARFSEALELRWSGQIAYNLGHARVSLGHLVEAVATLDQVLDHEGLEPAVRESAQTLRSQISHMLAYVTVRIQGGSEGVIAEVDGEPVTVGTAVAVDPGQHEVLATHEGQVVGRATAQVEAGESTTIVLTGLAPQAVASTVPLEDEDEGGSGVAIGVGVSIGIAAVVAVVIVMVLLAPFGGSDPLQGDLGEVGVVP